MAVFELAVAATLKNEGGFVDNKNDPGGATNMGITQADLPGQDIKTLTAAQATEYYQSHFWLPIMDQITSQKIANKIFDMRVLFGPAEAIMLLQQVTLQHMDGVFGPQTLNIVNTTDETILLNIYKVRLAQHARNIMASKPQEFVFLQGWINRINS